MQLSLEGLPGLNLLIHYPAAAPLERSPSQPPMAATMVV